MIGNRKRRSEAPTTILIADDYPFYRRGLRVFLEEQPDLAVVGEAGSAEELLRLAEQLKPDVVLLDLDLAGANGTDLVRAVRSRAAATKLVVFITPDDANALAACVEDGADGCIMKNAEPPLILSAVRAVCAGEPWIQREMTGRLFAELRRARQAERERLEAALSDRETEILRLLAEGLRNSQIAQRLFISERTVKVHVANIFSKLGLHDRVQATRYAIRSGLVRL